MTDDQPLIRLSGVDLGYGSRIVLSGIDLAITRGDYIGIVGPNGAGKSTLLLALLGVLPPLRGTVQRPARVRFGYVPQRGALDDIFPLDVADVVRMGLELYQEAGATDGRIAEALDAVGLSELSSRRFSELSGGQRQRVLVARALVVKPDFLVLDEPTNGLDLPTEAALMEFFDSLHQRGMTVVLVTHLLGLVANHAQTLALVQGGRVVAGSTRTLLAPDRLEEIYGCSVQVGQVDGRLVVLPERRLRTAPGSPVGGSP